MEAMKVHKVWAGDFLSFTASIKVVNFDAEKNALNDY